VPETTGRRARRKTYRITRAGIVRLVALEGGETCEHLQNLVPPRTQNA
jgi:DNA-binding PadR family transcriptional regulator